jgi:hypothetical protein
MQQAQSQFGRGQGLPNQAPPEAAPVSPPQAAPIIDHLRRRKLLPPTSSTINTQIFDAGDMFVVVDATTGQQTPIRKEALQ